MDIETLSTVSEDQGTVVHLKDVTKKPMYTGEGDAKAPVTIRVAGSFSERYRAAHRKLRDERMAAGRNGGEVNAEMLDAQERALQAACILEWPFTDKGRPFLITTENWSTLLAKQPQWEAQVVEAMGDHARFFAGS